MWIAKAYHRKLFPFYASTQWWCKLYMLNTINDRPSRYDRMIVEAGCSYDPYHWSLFITKDSSISNSSYASDSEICVKLAELFNLPNPIDVMDALSGIKEERELKCG